MNSDCDDNIKSSSRKYQSEFVNKLNYVYTSRQCDEYLDYLEELRKIIFGKETKRMLPGSTTDEDSIHYHTKNGKTLTYRLENVANYGISLSPLSSETEKNCITETVFSEPHVEASVERAPPLQLSHLPSEVEERMLCCLRSSKEYLAINKSDQDHYRPSTSRSEHLHTVYPDSACYAARRISRVNQERPKNRENLQNKNANLSNERLEQEYTEDVMAYGDTERLDDVVDEKFAAMEEFASVLEESESVFEEVEDYTEELEDYEVTEEEIGTAIVLSQFLETPVRHEIGMVDRNSFVHSNVLHKTEEDAFVPLFFGDANDSDIVIMAREFAVGQFEASEEQHPHNMSFESSSNDSALEEEEDDEAPEIRQHFDPEKEMFASVGSDSYVKFDDSMDEFDAFQEMERNELVNEANHAECDAEEDEIEVLDNENSLTSKEEDEACLSVVEALRLDETTELMLESELDCQVVNSTPSERKYELDNGSFVEPVAAVFEEPRTIFEDQVGNEFLNNWKESLNALDKLTAAITQSEDVLKEDVEETTNEDSEPREQECYEPEAPFTGLDLDVTTGHSAETTIQDSVPSNNDELLDLVRNYVQLVINAPREEFHSNIREDLEDSEDTTAGASSCTNHVNGVEFDTDNDDSIIFMTSASVEQTDDVFGTEKKFGKIDEHCYTIPVTSSETARMRDETSETCSLMTETKDEELQATADTSSDAFVSNDVEHRLEIEDQSIANEIEFSDLQESEQSEEQLFDAQSSLPSVSSQQSDTNLSDSSEESFETVIFNPSYSDVLLSTTSVQDTVFAAEHIELLQSENETGQHGKETAEERKLDSCLSKPGLSGEDYDPSIHEEIQREQPIELSNFQQGSKTKENELEGNMKDENAKPDCGVLMKWSSETLKRASRESSPGFDAPSDTFFRDEVNTVLLPELKEFTTTKDCHNLPLSVSSTPKDDGQSYCVGFSNNISENKVEKNLKELTDSDLTILELEQEGTETLPIENVFEEEEIGTIACDEPTEKLIAAPFGNSDQRQEEEGIELSEHVRANSNNIDNDSSALHDAAETRKMIASNDQEVAFLSEPDEDEQIHHNEIVDSREIDVQVEPETVLLENLEMSEFVDMAKGDPADDDDVFEVLHFVISNIEFLGIDDSDVQIVTTNENSNSDLFEEVSESTDDDPLFESSEYHSCSEESTMDYMTPSSNIPTGIRDSEAIVEIPSIETVDEAPTDDTFDELFLDIFASEVADQIIYDAVDTFSSEVIGSLANYYDLPQKYRICYAIEEESDNASANSDEDELIPTAVPEVQVIESNFAERLDVFASELAAEIVAITMESVQRICVEDYPDYENGAQETVEAEVPEENDNETDKEKIISISIGTLLQPETFSSCCEDLEADSELNTINDELMSERLTSTDVTLSMPTSTQDVQVIESSFANLLNNFASRLAAGVVENAIESVQQTGPDDLQLISERRTSADSMLSLPTSTQDLQVIENSFVDLLDAFASEFAAETVQIGIRSERETVVQQYADYEDHVKERIDLDNEKRGVPVSSIKKALQREASPSSTYVLPLRSNSPEHYHNEKAELEEVLVRNSEDEETEISHAEENNNPAPTSDVTYVKVEEDFVVPTSQSQRDEEQEWDDSEQGAAEEKNLETCVELNTVFEGSSSIHSTLDIDENNEEGIYHSPVLEDSENKCDNESVSLEEHSGDSNDPFDEDDYETVADTELNAVLEAAGSIDNIFYCSPGQITEELSTVPIPDQLLSPTSCYLGLLDHHSSSSKADVSESEPIENSTDDEPDVVLENSDIFCLLYDLIDVLECEQNSLMQNQRSSQDSDNVDELSALQISSTNFSLVTSVCVLDEGNISTKESATTEVVDNTVREPGNERTEAQEHAQSNISSSLSDVVDETVEHSSECAKDRESILCDNGESEGAPSCPVVSDNLDKAGSLQYLGNHRNSLTEDTEISFNRSNQEDIETLVEQIVSDAFFSLSNEVRYSQTESKVDSVLLHEELVDSLPISEEERTGLDQCGVGVVVDIQENGDEVPSFNSVALDSMESDEREEIASVSDEFCKAASDSWQMQKSLDKSNHNPDMMNKSEEAETQLTSSRSLARSDASSCFDTPDATLQPTPDAAYVAFQPGNTRSIPSEMTMTLEDENTAHAHCQFPTCKQTIEVNDLVDQNLHVSSVPTSNFETSSEPSLAVSDAVPENSSLQEPLTTESSFNHPEPIETSSVVEEVSYLLTTACVAALVFVPVSESSPSSSFTPDIIEDAAQYLSSQPKNDSNKK